MQDSVIWVSPPSARNNYSIPPFRNLKHQGVTLIDSTLAASRQSVRQGLVVEEVQLKF
ncbi:MAG: hypothetical protein NW224_14325 [Leptolyngbyaceae cyanobacterium bins.302]|nr:hypothetical protein [Leptolyngbyaceae cyanobacterium bins.302]